MAFSKHNIEKHHLIELVKRNPILWDCRLPHYKRSDKKKDIKWADLGRTFNVSGARVQRTFTSMREIFRRELSHEKLLGDRFRSKWEFYDEMCFLKDVIRERKSRGFHMNMSTENGYSSEHMDGNHSFEPHVQVLLNNDNTHHNSHHHHHTNGIYKADNNNSSAPVDDHNNNNNHDNNAPSSSCSSSPPSLRIKSESPENVRNNTQNASDNSDYEQEDFPRISLLPQNTAHRNQLQPHLLHHRTRPQDHDDEETEMSTTPKRTPREIYYSKFGEFLTARLNVLSDDKANDLVSKILLLMAQHE